MDLRVAGSPQTCMAYQITTLLHGGRLVQLADHMVRIRTGCYELSYYTAAELFVITLRTVSQIPVLCSASGWERGGKRTG